MRPWYCARTHYNQEFEARKHIERMGFPVFLPSYLVKYKSSNIRPKLLFRNYIFFSLDDLMDWPRVRHAFGVADVLLYSPTDDDASTVPWYQMPSPAGSKAIESLRALALSYDEIRRTAKVDAPSRPVQIITQGCYVRIDNGPLKDFSVQKPVVDWADEERAFLVLSIFGRQHRIEFYLKDLSLAEPPHA